MAIYNSTRLKVQLKLAVNRLRLLQAKKDSLAKQARKNVSQLLENGKVESARIRVENIIREDYNIEAMEILELCCELLLARFGLLEQMKHCDPSIAEAVSTIIYAAPRSEAKELNMVRDQLVSKFGREFSLAAMENLNDCVNHKIIAKLRIDVPDPTLVDRYLEEIAKSYNVKWRPTNSVDADSDDDNGGLQELEAELEASNSIKQPVLLPGGVNVDNNSQMRQHVNFPGTPSAPPERRAALGPPPGLPILPVNQSGNQDKKLAASSSSRKDDELPDFDELSRRFEALKKRP
ncbi:uncharacterized protein VTP21DRAFT_10416 [Calcarisporiella thermophila]|uniref:uncharacterized protein n=1 Tax=Calcarisporiella thermophila TaxID=911321 RepID=UPI003742B6C2